MSGKRERNAWATGEALAGKELFEAKGNFEGNSTDVIFRAALAGIGIARLPCYMTDPKFASGELIHILPGYSLPNTDIAVLFANTRNLARKTRAFFDLIAAHFGEKHSALVETA
ncbi:LysR substrate-binding domain-containing protein [Phaeobacter gallaeciensis]|nr:LysR substrate-binding domain-containing protein [Phaeobacter gallaeciensis]MDE4304970.1 LysR substrate-binding domain-containing protein [Phaeobacter gallaeciensis]MDE4309318.1 LysR substrate-binding domain-containing protein [Phaeobacter gallaeciensis]MDE4313775.1 LysR substrate-binding domain-containing protein [Phaeobacter gallaeciensis]MDE4318247.1 LysR substrate-binding domain-containing protein [Phaeobacter gallaeciensis]MDE4323261.1 LysR substrate-binding domain-containing protein [